MDYANPNHQQWTTTIAKIFLQLLFLVMLYLSDENQPPKNDPFMGRVCNEGNSSSHNLEAYLKQVLFLDWAKQSLQPALVATHPPLHTPTYSPTKNFVLFYFMP